MRKIMGIIGVWLCVFLCQVANGEIWYVDGSVAASGDGTSWATAFQKIQEGIDAASDADTVIVAPGTYFENIHFHGKNITLTSIYPPDPDIVANTIIDGSQSGSVVTFLGTEDETCVLSGFTIRNGKAKNGGGICGGSSDSHTHATIENNAIMNNRAAPGWVHGGGLAYCDGVIRNNVITGNSAEDCGGGLYSCHGTIQNNSITGNSAEYGAGLFGCDGVIQNNVIEENWAEEAGGGLSYCDGEILNNIISGNSAQERSGGGLDSCREGIVRNNIITANSAYQEGGGLYDCSYGIIQNNTIIGNSAEGRGGGMHHCHGTILNCIVSGNRAPRAPQISFSTQPTYSCIESWIGTAEGNISFNPHFTDPENGDFHLKSWSPCIDAGDPASPVSDEPEPNGGRINMGAYGNTPEAASKSPDVDADGLPDDWEMHWFKTPEWNGPSDPDGDGIINITEWHYAWDPTVAAETLVQNLTKGLGYQTIQAALCESDEGNEIVVHPAIYTENINFAGKNVVLRSTDPSDPQIVANTVIDGGGLGSVVTFLRTEKPTCVLAGFTIQNGRAEGGSGIRGGDRYNHTQATIQNNVITANSADGEDSHGGGVAYCRGLVENNTITGNSATYGGGLAYCSGTIQNNSITNNRADYHGGGLYECRGMVRDNAIIGNSATYTYSTGGGMAHCDGTIQNNTITGNSARNGGGLSFCDGTILNNIISANSAQGRGGALADCEATIRNNTIVKNSADDRGAGFYRCQGIIQNCIIWGNVGRTELDYCSLPTYSCIHGSGAGGEGSIAFNPYFVDAENGDFHVKACSPCIDAGDPSSPFSNEPEPNGGRVNMGAYGNTPEATCKSPDTDADGLPDDWERLWFGDLEEDAAGDPDCDQIANITEYRYAWQPIPAMEARVTNLAKGTRYPNIQVALSDAAHGDEIVVYPGVYAETIDFGGKNIVLRSTDPDDDTVVAQTIIDGGKHGPVVVFSGTEDETCVLSGFTIRNGQAPSAEWGRYYGGGIHGRGTHATIENNIITGNVGVRGGGVCECDGTLRNNTITGNSASSGGGVAECGGLIENNTISENRAQFEGGGLVYCEATIENNAITDNSAYRYGGGLYRCDGTISGNLLARNSAGRGGGLENCRGTIQNNVITGNSADSAAALCLCHGPIQNNIITGNSGRYSAGIGSCHGIIQNNVISGNLGGLSRCDGTIQNNTIVGNFAGEGAALDHCRGTIINCIIWGNAAPNGAQLDESSLPTYSCIQGWTEGGEGNIAEHPRFVDADNGNFRLLPDSPCIDAGFNDSKLPETDVVGMHRIMYGGKSLTVDMGAYEYYINNVQFRPAAGETTLTWSSLADRSYSIFYTDDLLTWHPVADNFPSAGNETTSWIDDGSLTGLPPSLAPRRFYRILENP